MYTSLAKCIFTKLSCISSESITCKCSAVRTFLSSAYANDVQSQPLALFPDDAEQMALQTLSLDRCHERDMPVSSLMIDRMVNAIDNKQHLSASLYYLYKFRHSQNGYYLQPWTVHAFVNKCLKIDSNVLLETLKQKSHYGVFPNKFTMNLVIDHFLMNDNITGAAHCAGEMFLLETLDNKVAQILSVQAVVKYWKEFSQGGELLPRFRDAVLKRNLSAVLYCVGLHLSHPSLIIIGQSILGSIEQEHGILSVYQEPWGPLSTEPNYFLKVIDYIQNLEQKISQQSVDILLLCTEENETLHALAQAASAAAKDRSLITDEANMTLSGIASSLLAELRKNEPEDLKDIHEQFSTWISDRNTLNDLEKEILNEYKTKRERYFREREIEEKSHKMAVETLGYWDMAKDKDTEKESIEETKPIFYLREDYVDGALEDLELEEKIRDLRSIVVNPIILNT